MEISEIAFDISKIYSRKVVSSKILLIHELMGLFF